MLMVMLILDNPDLCNEVLDAWDKAGAKGVTILRSTGLGRIRKRIGLRDDTPLMPSLDEFLQQDESQHRTMISVVDNQQLVDQLVEATQKVTGDLNLPHTGILVVLPVAAAYGLDRKSSADPGHR